MGIDADDYEDNPYLFATGGPKKKIDYSRPEGDDGDGFESYDAAAYDFEADGSYKVQHKNEKFTLLTTKKSDFIYTQ